MYYYQQIGCAGVPTTKTLSNTFKHFQTLSNTFKHFQTLSNTFKRFQQQHVRTRYHVGGRGSYG